MAICVQSGTDDESCEEIHHYTDSGKRGPKSLWRICNIGRIPRWRFSNWNLWKVCSGRDLIHFAGHSECLNRIKLVVPIDRRIVSKGNRARWLGVGILMDATIIKACSYGRTTESLAGPVPHYHACAAVANVAHCSSRATWAQGFAEVIARMSQAKTGKFLCPASPSVLPITPEPKWSQTYLCRLNLSIIGGSSDLILDDQTIRG